MLNSIADASLIILLALTLLEQLPIAHRDFLVGNWLARKVAELNEYVNPKFGMHDRHPHGLEPKT